MPISDLPPIPDQATFLETLSPNSIGAVLMESFQGYDQSQHAPLPMQYLLQRYYLCPSYDGDPVFTLRSPKEGDAIAPWSYHSGSSHPATTDKFTPYSPHIVPEDVENADTIVTVTDTHHYYLATRAIQDMVFAFDEHDITPRAYWYLKHWEYDVPKPMFSLDPVRNLLQHQPERWRIGALLELWTPTNTVDRDSGNIIGTYQLQAGYTLKGLSLVNYLAFLSLDPQIFNKSPSGRISLTK